MLVLGRVFHHPWIVFGEVIPEISPGSDLKHISYNIITTGPKIEMTMFKGKFILQPAILEGFQNDHWFSHGLVLIKAYNQGILREHSF